MAYAKTARRPGKAPIGDKRDLGPHALAVKRSRGRQHLAHAGPPARTLVADYENATFCVAALRHRFKTSFFVVEAKRRPLEDQRRFRHARDLHDRPVGCEAPLQTNDAAGGGDWLVSRPDNVLVRVPCDFLEILADGPARDGHTVAVQETLVEERLHEK